MATLTDMELQAIQDTRQSLWDALVAAIGEDEATRLFAGLTGETIDYIINAIWNGVRASMQRQSATGAIPVPIGDNLNDPIPF